MNSRGYTLLEVSLFLAISGALTLVAVVGLGPRLTNARFTTTMRDLQANIAKELSTSARGESQAQQRLDCRVGFGLQIDDVVTDTTSSPCVYVGKVALLGESNGSGGQQVRYHSIVAAIKPTSPTCSPDPSSFDYIVRCSQARILGRYESPSSYDYVNQLTQPLSISPTSTKYGYGFVRSVDTNTTHRFVFTYSVNVSGNAVDRKGASLNSPSLTYLTSEESVCYKMNNRRAVLVISPQLSEPKLLFNQGSC